MSTSKHSFNAKDFYEGIKEALKCLGYGFSSMECMSIQLAFEEQEITFEIDDRRFTIPFTDIRGGQ